MTDAQNNVLESLKSLSTKGRVWLPLSVLESFDGRTINALLNAGKIRIDFEYGVKVK